MKATKVLLVLLVTVGLIIWVRGGESFDIRKVLPLANDKPPLYQVGGVVMALLSLWGIARLGSQSQEQDRSRDDEAEDAQYDDEE